MLEFLKENYILEGRQVDGRFTKEDFTKPIFTRKYSDYLLGEVKDQVSFYYSAKDWEHVVSFFQFLKGQSFFDYHEYIYAYDEYVDFLTRNNKEIPAFAVTPDTLLQFLYDLGILCYMSEAGGATFFGWCFHDRTATNISPKVRTNVKYKIHFGLRKALDLGRPLS